MSPPSENKLLHSSQSTFERPSTDVDVELCAMESRDTMSAKSISSMTSHHSKCDEEHYAALKGLLVVGISSVLLTILGFVVGLSLSFRNSTAYERYSEGRRYWSQLASVTQSLARLVWVHADERPECPTEDLLAKITFCNMLVSLSVALKHRLRYEPFTHYQDLQPCIGHIPVIAHDAVIKEPATPTWWQDAGLFLGLPMVEENPRVLMKNPAKPLGNVPLEIHSACSNFIKTIIENGTFKTPGYHSMALALLSQINDILNGVDRVLNTPLPLAYSIAIAQITWVYILVLPFQLVDRLKWVTIPATIFAAYIILGLAFIGREIENPFGKDVNDLPLDSFCMQIRQDIDVIMSQSPHLMDELVKRDDNEVLYPLSRLGYGALASKSVDEIRSLLRAKMQISSDCKTDVSASGL
ncbi:hypothetical protein E4U43_007288 [Claviceps pusilla]|uniref:Uncharacterized protein n=1 Tax=Claviceps pusilla TaxID=123648 RepID=A0A9P7T1S6_9HYPO|nr:hypothetical protein E4U43_007288 [Claviceps pusilla]